MLGTQNGSMTCSSHRLLSSPGDCSRSTAVVVGCSLVSIAKARDMAVSRMFIAGWTIRRASLVQFAVSSVCVVCLGHGGHGVEVRDPMITERRMFSH